MNCVTKLELDTLKHAIMMEVAFAVTCAVASALINHVGKFRILCKYSSSDTNSYRSNKKKLTG